MDKERTLHVALIGLGARGLNGTTRAIHAVDNVEISAICDMNQERLDKGMELTTWAGTDNIDGKIAVGTIRVTAMALAGSELKQITLPYTVRSVGHKAFYKCADLKQVVFTSYEAPILEEEFDRAYYETLEAVPGSGNYGEYEDFDGKQVEIIGAGFVPFYMWNAQGGMYSNVFYGANFVDYVGFVEQKLNMVRPINGQHYETFVMEQYFDLIIDGGNAADDVTLAAIAAIDAIPERVTYEQKYLVEAARAAYDQVATTEQQALVTNYADLISAEQRISALAPTTEQEGSSVPETKAEMNLNPYIWAVVLLLVIVVAGVFAGRYVLKNKKDLGGVIPAIKAALPFKKSEKPEEVTEVPVYDEPAAETPAVAELEFEAPEFEAPVEETPVVAEPEFEAPAVETPAAEEAPELVFPPAKMEMVNGKERLIPGWKQLKDQNNQ